MAEAAAAYPVATSLLASAGGSLLVGELMKPDAPAPMAPPPITPPETMPDPNARSARDAKRASIQEQLRRRGRASTILTQNDSVTGDKLGA